MASSCTKVEIGFLDLTITQNEISHHYLANYSDSKKSASQIESGWTSDRGENDELQSLTLFSSLDACTLDESDCLTVEIGWSTKESYMLAMEGMDLNEKTDALVQFFQPGLRIGTYNNGESGLSVQVYQLDDTWINDPFGDANSTLMVESVNIVVHPVLDELVAEVRAALEMTLFNVGNPEESIFITGDVLNYYRIPFE